MKDMKTNNQAIETETCAEKKQAKSKKGYIVGGVCILALILGVIFGMNNSKPLELEGLVEGIEYEVVDVVQEEQIQVDIQMDTDAEESDVVEVVKAIVAEVQEDKGYQEGQIIRVEVFNDVPVSETEEVVEKPSLEDETHDYTAIYEETIKLYQLVDMSEVDANILATNDWVINDSKYTDGHLTGKVVLSEGQEESVIYAQLKAIESEMKRFNKVAEDKHTYFYTPQIKQVSFGYSSVFPNHLILEKEITILK